MNFFELESYILKEYSKTISWSFDNFSKAKYRDSLCSFDSFVDSREGSDLIILSGVMSKKRIEIIKNHSLASTILVCLGNDPWSGGIFSGFNDVVKISELSDVFEDVILVPGESPNFLQLKSALDSYFGGKNALH